MRYILRVFAIALFLGLALSSIVRAQATKEHPEYWEASEPPHEIIPLERLIHYPKEAKKKKIEGNVTVDILLGIDGIASKVNILKSDDTIFNAEALRVLKVARFTPAKQNGTPLKLWITRTIHFRLKPSKADQQGWVYPPFPIVTY